jgi:hypothetical protein
VKIFVAVIAIVASIANSQNLDTIQEISDTVPEYQINPMRLAIVGGTIGALYTAAVLGIFLEGWWKYYEPFNFEPFHDDMIYAVNMDKFGHFYVGILFGESFMYAYDWVGFSPFYAAFWAAVTVGFTQIAVELKDGFSPYGFSVLDAVSGTLGGLYAMGKRFVPAFAYVDYKLAYWPTSRKYYWDEVKKNPKEEGVFTDDYPNYSHWISFKIEKMLPSAAKPYWPGFLGLAFGWAMDCKQYTHPGNDGGYEYYLSLDYDLEAIFNPSSTWGKNLLAVINHIKFPAPAIRFGENARFFPLHPTYGFAVNL